MACTRSLTKLCISLIGIAPVFVFGASALAQSARIEAQEANNRACQQIYDVNIEESNARKAQSRIIPKDDYAALCRFGRQVGNPGLVKALDRFKQSKTCNPKYSLNREVIRKMAEITEQNRLSVERDCARAGL